MTANGLEVMTPRSFVFGALQSSYVDSVKWLVGDVANRIDLRNSELIVNSL